MQGTLDDTAFITAPTAMQFMDMMGGPQAIFTYNHGLLGQVCAPVHASVVAPVADLKES